MSKKKTELTLREVKSFLHEQFAVEAGNVRQLIEGEVSQACFLSSHRTLLEVICKATLINVTMPGESHALVEQKERYVMRKAGPFSTLPLEISQL